MASIHEYTLKDGVTRRYFVSYRDPAHKQHTKRGFKRKRDAKDYRDRVEVSVADMDYIDPKAGQVLISELGTAWLEGKKGTVKPKYQGDLETSWNVHVKPQWGSRRIGDVRHSEVQAWVSELAGRRSATTTIRSFGILKGIFDVAVADGIVRKSPVADTKLPRKVRKSRVYLTPQQVIALADESGRYRALVLTLGFCGPRWGEAAALRVKDIDFDRKRILIRLSYVRAGRRHYEGAPKTWETRDIPAPDIVLDALRGECEGKQPDDLVFTNAKGEHIREQAVGGNGWYAGAVRRSGVPALAVHDLRHSAASIAISSGANVKAVQRMLGHKSASMTLDVYGDLFDTDLDSVAVNVNAKIAEALAGDNSAITELSKTS
ncbi:tyrosine-type recombinase/integrase [Bifidobacterium sp.]|jgi:integrase|uniref:tyrosine-type recombinase/integrase n=1 Tax=Bifidobacterium sp. TaxID=41200 RepID=UPI0025C427BF|nr:site-specific integrase [Bifidobacterium sp.]MCH4209870.1 site-specific integrase [Bifidobacterium sp.]MCI1224493.1 site-specific integrase [Bifidobacterium sp.]